MISAIFGTFDDRYRGW